MAAMALLSAVREALTYHELLRTLLARDLKVRYKHSVLGFFWSLLRPLLVIAVLVFVFQVLLETSIPNFALFIIVGYLVWSYTADALSAAVRSVVNNAVLVKRVYFPRELLPAAAVLAHLVHFLLALLLVLPLVVLGGIPLTVQVLWLPSLILFQTLFLLGVGLVLAAANVFFRDVEAALDPCLIAWFFATPILYDLGTVFSREWAGINLGWLVHALNPMASFITSYRLVLIGGGVAPDPAFMVRTYATALLVLVGGYAVFKYYEPRFGEEL
ncbi:MAG TPA: ABC transporter permease [Chloroflexota bacterium]|nr:ABC transporter permease [Chloroflexota bacterium]